MKKRNIVPFAMLLIWLITIAATCFSAYVYLKTSDALSLCAATVFGSAAMHFLIMFVSAPIVSIVFRKRYRYHSLWFREKPFEKKLYQMLRVKQWKVKLPAYDRGEYSHQDNHLESIIHNMCHAEVVHEVIMLAGYIPAFLGRNFLTSRLIFAFSVCFSVFHLFFVIIQRYNRPRVIRIYEKTKRVSRRF